MVGWQLPGSRCEQGEMSKRGAGPGVLTRDFSLDTVPLSYVFMCLLTHG